METKKEHKRRLYRSLLGTEVMASSELCQIYIYLLLKAAWSPCAFKASSRAYRLRPGQAVWGKYAAAGELGISPSAAWRRLHSLEDTGMVILDAHSDCTIVTIRGWEKQYERASGQVKVMDGWISISDALLGTNLIRHPKSLHLYLMLSLRARPFASEDGDVKAGQLVCPDALHFRQFTGVTAEKAMSLIRYLVEERWISLESSLYHGRLISICEWEKTQATPQRYYEDGEMMDNEHAVILLKDCVEKRSKRA